MPPNERYLLRLVIQRRLEAHRPCYRVITYGDGAVYCPLDFTSPADVVKSLRPILPSLHENELAWSDDSPHAQIIFTADIVAEDEQLQLVGLKSRQ